MSTATKNIWLWTNFKSPQPKKFVTSKVKKWLWKEKTRKWLWNLYGPTKHLLEFFGFQPLPVTISGNEGHQKLRQKILVGGPGGHF